MDPTDGGPGRRPYALVAGSGIPAFDTAGQQIVSVRSSRADFSTLIADADPDACPEAPLRPITDPDALDFEGNDNVFRTHDRNGLSRMAAGMLPLTGFPPEGRIACLENAILQAGGRWMSESAWRPAPYQDHLREILDKRDRLERLGNPPSRSAVRAQVEAEKLRHELGDVVSRRSAHTRGEAIDIGAPGLSSETIDSAARSCGLRRLPAVLRPGDPGHFSMEGN